MDKMGVTHETNPACPRLYLSQFMFLRWTPNREIQETGIRNQDKAKAEQVQDKEKRKLVNAVD